MRPNLTRIAIAVFMSVGTAYCGLQVFFSAAARGALLGLPGKSGAISTTEQHGTYYLWLGMISLTLASVLFARALPTETAGKNHPRFLRAIVRHVAGAGAALVAGTLLFVFLACLVRILEAT